MMATPDSPDAVEWETKAEQLLRDNADVTVISFPKCGRTWLSLMATSYIARSMGRPDLAEHITEGRLRTLIPERERDYVKTLIALREEGATVPLIIFLHKVDYFRPYFFRQPTASRTEKNILLIRDPRDIIVSFYHHVVHKNRGRISLKPKARLSADTTLAEFIYSDLVGFRKVVAYLTDWLDWIAERDQSVVRYEDLVADTDATLSVFLRAAGVEDPDPGLVTAVVEEFSFDSLRRAEKERGPDRHDPSLRRMRKGKIGGFAAEADPREVAFMNDILEGATNPWLARYVEAPAAAE